MEEGAVLRVSYVFVVNAKSFSSKKRDKRGDERMVSMEGQRTMKHQYL